MGSAARVKDQIYEPKEDIPDEDILLRRRELGTDYEVSLEIGFSYTFGSVFNNVVNPRMSTGGGRGDRYRLPPLRAPTPLTGLGVRYGGDKPPPLKTRDHEDALTSFDPKLEDHQGPPRLSVVSDQGHDGVFFREDRLTLLHVGIDEPPDQRTYVGGEATGPRPRGGPSLSP